MTMLPVRTALLGFGYAGRTFHAPLLEAVEGIAFSLVGSSRPDDVHARYPNVLVSSAQEAVIDPEIDLVVIATPNDSHFPLAAAALRAGKHVVVDKPFTLNLQEAKDLQQIANEHGRILSVFHNRRWESEIKGAREVLQSGVLGQVTHYELHMDRFLSRTQLRRRNSSCETFCTSWKTAGGAL